MIRVPFHRWVVAKGSDDTVAETSTECRRQQGQDPEQQPTWWAGGAAWRSVWLEQGEGGTGKKDVRGKVDGPLRLGLLL